MARGDRHRVDIAWYAIPNGNKACVGCWLPVYEEDGKQRGDTYSGRRLGLAEAEAEAEATAHERASRYIGDYEVHVTKKTSGEGAPAAKLDAEIRAELGKQTSRDLRNGQYKMSKMEALCVCGHTLGDHTAERDAKAKEQECLVPGCPCSFFTRVKKAKSR